ncbi:MAG: ACT domain-containing protein [Synergistaceae bacterium]|jgi:aspartate kinase|nr:ACT domain-containing protein [Synergistaceae bacterium]
MDTVSMDKKARVGDVRADRSAVRITLLGVPDVPGVAARVFSPLAELEIGVEMIVQNTMRGGVTDIAFLVRRERLDDAIGACRKAAREIGAQGVSFNTEIARVSLTGENLDGMPAKMFSALAAASVNIEMIVSNPLFITCVVAASEAEKATAALREAFLRAAGT